MNEDTKFDADRLLECLVEISSLSKIKRTGWILAGVRESESVSDHCFETAIFAYLLSRTVEQPVDVGKLLLMALFHEVGEARVTDLPRRSKPYVKRFKRTAEEDAAADVLDGVSQNIMPLLTELHATKTIEARIVEAAEEFQIIFRAMLYAKENNGDMTEYRGDVDRYDCLGVEAAKALTEKVRKRLDEYLEGRPHWSVGYHLRHGHHTE